MIIKKFAILSMLLLILSTVAMTQQDTTKAVVKDSAKVEMTPAPKTDMSATLKVCTSIEERMPVGESTKFTPANDMLYLWSQIFGATDSTFIQHIWLYKGDTMSTVELPVRSAAWRTWSSKTIIPSWTGDWEVKVISANGAEIGSVKFVIEE
ncbi:MAG: DUF2914 domain-containing protein [Candidatus Zixiibacteriota bacterium]